MGFWHRIQHVLKVNTRSRVVRIGDEYWVTMECRREGCGAELCRWFYKHRISPRRVKRDGD